MDRVIKSSCPVVDGDNEFVVELRQSDISTLVIELCMLSMGVVKKIKLLFDAGNKLEIGFGATISPSGKAIVLRKKNWVAFELSPNQLEYLCAFLLRAYRDQVAEVNHIHIEGKEGDGEYDLTLIFDDYAPPLTPDEASKLMGD